MSKSRLTIIAVLVGSFGLSCLSNVQAQTFADLMSGIIQDGHSAEMQIWNAYNQSWQTEQNLYQQAMQNPQVHARYHQYLAAGGQSSFSDYAVYYVQSGGGNSQIFNHSMRRQANSNAQNRNAIFSNYNDINRMNQEIHNHRNQSMEYQNRLTGEQLLGQATYYNEWGSFQVPTTLTYGSWAADNQGNMFAVDAWNQPHLFDNWRWQPLYYPSR